MVVPRLVPALLSGLLAAVAAVPLLPAAAAAQDATELVEVAALVERPDGRLEVRRSTARRDQARSAVAALRSRADVVAADVAVAVRAFSTVPPPDPEQQRQYGVSMVRADASWSFGDASAQVVAVVDSGVDLGHPDLAPALVAGRDLVDGDSVPADLNGHGTHVAGIAGAVAGNGLGGVGAALRAKVMPVRVLDAGGAGSSADVAEGVVWAVDHGATVVNLSLGSPRRDDVLARAVQYALDRGVPVVAAAGNEALDGDPVNYPAALPGVIAVGAVDSSRVRASFSSTGAHLAVAAPGVGVLSTVRGGGYGTMSGTSMAAPFVSAGVALLRTTAQRATPADLRRVVMTTAADAGPAGHDAQYGAGVVDVLAARQYASPGFGAAAATATAGGALELTARTTWGGAAVRSWTASGGLGGVVDLGGAILGTPAVAAPTGRLDVVVRGSDQGIWLTSRPTGGNFGGWTPLGGVLTSRPTAAATGSRVDVAARGRDGAVYLRSSTSPGSWTPWQLLGGGLLPGTSPTLVWTSPTRLELFAVGTDTQVWRRSMVGGTWGPWAPFGGYTHAEVSVASHVTGGFTVALQGRDGAVYVRTVTPTADSGWSSLGGLVSAPPAVAAVPGSGRTDVVATATDGSLWVSTRTSGWSGWRPA